MTAAVLIALVIGINTTIFSMVNALVTQPAPGVNPAGLVRIAIPERPGAPLISYPDYVDYRAQTTTLQALTAFTNGRVTLTSDVGSYALTAAAVDANFFDTIGVQPMRGRTFTPSEGRSTDSAGFVAILSYRVWQDQFGGDENIVGRAIGVNNQPATVIGVAPPNFRGTMLSERTDVWLPLLMYWSSFSPESLQRSMTDRGETPVDVIGRLATGYSLAAAQADFATMQARLNRSYPTADRPAVAIVRYAATAGGVMPAGAPTFLAIFSVITMLTVLIVSANVANLMLSRAVARQRETAVRQSLGASRWRVVRLLLAEGLSISLVAWVAACLIAFWASRAIPRLLPESPLGMSEIDFSPDWRVVAYAMVLAAIGTIAFSIAPAVRVWRQDALPWLKAGEHSVAPGRSRLSSALVVLQLAFSVVLLTIAGLATRSASLMMVDLGFDTKNLLLLTVRAPASATTRETDYVLIDRVKERLKSVPGVHSVSYVRTFARSRDMVRTAGVPQAVRANTHIIGPDYFQTMGLSPTAGRTLTAADRERPGAMAVINQNLADALWPAQSPLGKTMTLRALTFRGLSDVETEGVEVVGVMPNAFVFGFDLERADPRPNLISWSSSRSSPPPDAILLCARSPSTCDTEARTWNPWLRCLDLCSARSILASRSHPLGRWTRNSKA